MVYIDRKMVYIGSGVLRRPFIHLDVTTEEDKAATAIGTARKRNVHVMLKIMYMKSRNAAWHSQAMLLRYFHPQMRCLFNDVYMRTDMAGVEFLVRQLEMPTLGCQLWLDASAPRVLHSTARGAATG